MKNLLLYWGGWFPVTWKAESEWLNHSGLFPFWNRRISWKSFSRHEWDSSFHPYTCVVLTLKYLLRRNSSNRGDSDATVLFSNSWSFSKGSHCWPEGIGETSESLEEAERHKGREESFSLLLMEKAWRAMWGLKTEWPPTLLLQAGGQRHLAGVRLH